MFGAFFVYQHAGQRIGKYDRLSSCAVYIDKAISGFCPLLGYVWAFERVECYEASYQVPAFLF
jgi:hypothetical protein